MISRLKSWPGPTFAAALVALALMAAPVHAQAAPTVTLTPGDGRIAVAWTAVPNGINYEVRWRAGSSGGFASRSAGGGSVRTYTISPLTNGTEYEVGVRATTLVGRVTSRTPWTSDTATPMMPPPPPATASLPSIMLLRNAGDVGLEYAARVSETSTLLVSTDGALDLSPSCDVSSGEYADLQQAVRVYPCATGAGSVTVRVQGEDDAISATTRVVDPRYMYTVTVTSERDAAVDSAAIMWRALSRPLYDQGLLASNAGTANVLVSEGEGAVRPLDYELPDASLASASSFACPPQGACRSSGSALSNPPQVGDAVYWLAAFPFSLLLVDLSTDGRRDTMWALDWEYLTAGGWEPLPGVQDGTSGLSKDGTVAWDELVLPMARSSFTGAAGTHYQVRATVASTGSGAFTLPTITSSAADGGLWKATLETTLPAGGSTVLRVYVLPPGELVDGRTSGPSAADLRSPPADIEAAVSPWRPWQRPDPAPSVVAAEAAAIGQEVVDQIAQPIRDDGGLPLIGFAVEGATTAAGVPPLVLWIMIGMALAFAVLVAVQRVADNILLSVVAGGLVLGLITTPSIGISSVWALMVYALIGGAVVVIGRRLSL